MKKDKNAAERTKLRHRAEKEFEIKHGKIADLTGTSPEIVGDLIHELQVRQIELKMQNDELRRIQADLEDSRDNYSHLYDFAPIGYFTLGENGCIDEANLTLASLLGVVRSELLGKHFNRFVLKGDQDIFYRHQQRLKETQSHKCCELRLKGKGNDHIHARLEGIVVQNPQGRPQTRVAVMDITQQKTMEEKLGKSKKKYRRLFHLAQEGIWVIDKDNKTDFVNPSMAKMLGYTPQEMKGKSLFDFMDAQEVKIAERNIERRQKGIQEQHDFKFLHKDGSCIYTTLATSPILDDEGNYEGAIAGVMDITQRRLSEKELRSSETKYRSMMEAITDQLYICSPQSTVEYMNPAMIKRLGRDATGETCHKALHGLDHRCDWCVFNELSKGNSLDTSIVSPLDNRHYRVTNMPIQNQDGTISKMSIFRDITDYLEAIAEKNKAKDQLRQTQKMESIGTLAGGIAHDFNNILYPIIGFTELSIDELPQNHPVQENLEDILRGAQRASELVRQILLFSRQRGSEYQSILIQPVIEEALKLLRSTIPADIEIQHELYQDKKYVYGDATEIYEIVMNLCTNAYHAMEETGGTLNIALYEKKPDPKLDLPVGDYCCLKVSDTGTGILPGTIDTLFEPYVTTKELGKGTGLGLSVVHGIVKSLKGAIHVDSEPGKGTVFSIYLPLISEIIKTDDNPMVPDKETGGNERILFVDDEEIIVKLGIRILERLGYTVTGETSSMDAWALFKSKPDAFDLVITDMSMPGMIGTKLAEKLIKIRPETPIILCTGFSKRLDQKTAMGAGIIDYLHKPIIVGDLSLKVREVLDNTLKKRDLDNLN